MRILHVIPQVKSGGVEVAAFSSMEKLNKNNIFKIVAIEPPARNNMAGKVINLNSSIVNPFLILKFILLVRKENPDVIIFSLWKSNFLGLITLPLIKLMNKKTKLVTIIHSARYAHFFDKYITKLAVRYFDKVYADSEITRDFTFKNSGITPEVISFILRRPIAKSPDFSFGFVRFVFIGRINEIKNITRAIDFLSFLDKLDLDFVFDIYGPDEGVLNDCITRVTQANLVNKVFFKGEVENEIVPTLLKNYDFMLQFSKYEGMAMSIVESMQMGLVPCVTNVGQIKNYAYHRSNAFVLDINKIQDDVYLSEMAHSFYNLIFGPGNYKRMSQNALMTFSEQPIYAEDLECKIKQL